ncbi:MAG: domain S-box-containing protein [Segetibacter sp.]|nr:domain S-box-containing protein [Segetibacter sp.]
MTNTSLTSSAPEVLYNALFDALPGNSILLAIDAPRFTILAATPQYLKETATTKESLIGKGAFEAFPTNTDDVNDTGERDMRASCNYVLLHKETHYLPVQRYDLKNEDGTFTEKYWRVSNKPVFATDGQVGYILHSAEDITSKIKSLQQEEKMKGLEKAHNLFMQVPAVIGITKGNDHVLELANESALKLWGKSADIIGKPLSTTIPELHEQGILKLFDEVRETGKPYFANEVQVSTYRSGMQEVRYFDLVYQPYFDEDAHKATGVFTLSYDVTDMVMAKKKVEESELKYRTLFESMDQGFCIMNVIFDSNKQPVNFRYLEVNPAFEKQAGLKDTVGKTILELAPDIEKRWFEVYGNVALNGEPIRFIDESKALGRWFHVYAFHIGGNESRTVAALFTDITAQKKAEEEIRESEERFRNLADDSPMFVFIIDADPTASVSYWNKMWLDYTGQTLEEAIGRAWHGIIHTDDVPIVMEHYVPAFRNRNSYFIPAVRVKRHDGEYRWHAFKGSPRYLPDGDFNGYVGVGFDIHEQKLAEEAIKQSEAQLQIKVAERTLELENQKNLFDNILKNSSNGISVTEMIRDESGNVIDANTILANEAAIEYIGLPKEVFLAKTAVELDPNILDSTYGQSCLRTLATGEPAISQYYMEITGRWQELTISKLDDDHLIHIFTDVTRVKEAQLQLERTVEELKRSNANLEDFAYAASHDLKEPVRKIRTFSNRIQHNLQGRLLEQDLHYFERMEKATERMQYLIDDLLEYSHVSSATDYSEEIDMNKKVEQVLEDLEVEIAEKQAQVIVGRLPVIKGHRRQMLQLFQNLLTNALKFGRPGVGPVIKISAALVKGENIGMPNVPEECRSRMYNLVEISDNGIGFQQEYADKIFKMFQRLHSKAEYEGTGIGLAIVRKVVENHKGFIRADSEPGQGTTFSIFLPTE